MNLKETIIQQLRNDIVSGKYKGGNRLKEVELCRRFNVSRTPMREVLMHLEMEGLLAIVPNKGAVVKEFTINDVSDVYDVLISLEVTANRIACEKITEREILTLEEYQFLMENAVREKNLDVFGEINLRFHRLITEVTLNKYLITIRNNFRTMTLRFARFAIRNPKQIIATLEEHPLIIGAIKKRNPAMAEFAAREHMANAKNLMIDYLTKAAGGKDFKSMNITIRGVPKKDEMK